MGKNEIDEIFASKASGSGKAPPTLSSSSVSATVANGSKKVSKDATGPLESSSSKKKKRKRKTEEASQAHTKNSAIEPVEEEWGGITQDDDTASASKSELKAPPTVVEVVDASKATRVELPKPPKKKAKLAAPSQKEVGKDDDDALFKDSRGTGPRKKTEEGYRVFKEDELGINDAGGDTPDCPFDCNCCF